MNAKTRIQKLESVKREAVDVDNRQFSQEVRPHEIKYFIDAVQVDEAKYKKELAEYLCLRKNDNRPNEIIILCSYADGAIATRARG